MSEGPRSVTRLSKGLSGRDNASAFGLSPARNAPDRAVIAPQLDYDTEEAKTQEVDWDALLSGEVGNLAKEINRGEGLLRSEAALSEPIAAIARALRLPRPNLAATEKAGPAHHSNTDILA